MPPKIGRCTLGSYRRTLRGWKQPSQIVSNLAAATVIEVARLGLIPVLLVGLAACGGRIRDAGPRATKHHIPQESTAGRVGSAFPKNDLVDDTRPAPSDCLPLAEFRGPPEGLGIYVSAADFYAGLVRASHQDFQNEMPLRTPPFDEFVCSLLTSGARRTLDVLLGDPAPEGSGNCRPGSVYLVSVYPWTDSSFERWYVSLYGEAGYIALRSEGAGLPGSEDIEAVRTLTVRKDVVVTKTATPIWRCHDQNQACSIGEDTPVCSSERKTKCLRTGYDSQVDLFFPALDRGFHAGPVVAVEPVDVEISDGIAEFRSGDCVVSRIVPAGGPP